LLTECFDVFGKDDMGGHGGGFGFEGSVFSTGAGRSELTNQKH
jgi:hypothetical protein